MRPLRKQIGSYLLRFHHDQRGAMSLVSVFTIIVMAFLLGMVLNVCFQADSKIRMQNAADAATYSSGIVMARGMNSLAFTNHLLCDVFALTAFLREGADNKAEKIIPDILAAWEQSAPKISGASFSQFVNWLGQYPGTSLNFAQPELGGAILSIIAPQQSMVDKFSAWGRAFSAEVLPTLETILDNELIPGYQRALSGAIPSMSQMAAREIAARHGLKEGEIDKIRGRMGAAVWTKSATLFGTPQNELPAGLPVVDPQADQTPFYLQTARTQRERLAKTYLEKWNHEKLVAFDGAEGVGQMSQFAALWRGFTRGQLDKLLAENQDKNLLHVIWTPPDVQYSDESEDLRPQISFNWSSGKRSYFLESQYMVVGTVYWKPVRHLVPGLFGNPLSGDRVNFAQGMLFLPVPRLGYGEVHCPRVVTYWNPETGEHETVCHPGGESFPNQIVRYYWPTYWNLLNQNWQFKLVPATMPELGTILSQSVDGFNPPNLSKLSPQDIWAISMH